MLYGSNHSMGIPGQTAIRIYNQPHTGVPSEWPGEGQQYSPSMIGIVSIRPDPEKAANGELDAELAAYWHKAPPSSLVTLWHEANDPNEHQDPTTIWRMHNHCAALARRVAPWVKYGAIIGTYPVIHQGQDLNAWLPVGQLDWAGMDGYMTTFNDNPIDTFATATHALRALRTPRIVITETNVLTADLSAFQTPWMAHAMTMAISGGFAGLLTYYNHPGANEPPRLRPDLNMTLARQAAWA